MSLPDLGPKPSGRVTDIPALAGRGWGPADRPVAWTVVVLGATIAVSRALTVARAGFPSDLPPLFLQWDPLVGPEAAIVSRSVGDA